MPLELFPARLPLILSGRLALPTFGMYLLCRRRLDVREFRVGQACVPEIPAALIVLRGSDGSRRRACLSSLPSTKTAGIAAGRLPFPIGRKAYRIPILTPGKLMPMPGA